MMASPRRPPRRGRRPARGARGAASPRRRRAAPRGGRARASPRAPSRAPVHLTVAGRSGVLQMGEPRTRRGPRGARRRSAGAARPGIWGPRTSPRRSPPRTRRRSPAPSPSWRTTRGFLLQNVSPRGSTCRGGTCRGSPTRPRAYYKSRASTVEQHRPPRNRWTVFATDRASSSCTFGRSASHMAKKMLRQSFFIARSSRSSLRKSDKSLHGLPPRPRVGAVGEALL